MGDILRAQIEKELEICLDVNRIIGNETVAFLAVVVAKDTQKGEYTSTVINICGTKVSDETKNNLSDNMHSLADTIKEAFVEKNEKE